MTGLAEPLQRSTGVALWRQLEIRLAGEIAALEPEARLPPEAELAQRFCVNRHTVRQAIRALAGRGLVRVEQGKGAFVRDLIDYRLGPRTRFSANLLAAERVAHRRILEMQELQADGQVAAALGLNVADLVLQVRSLGEADGVPVVVGTHLLPVQRLPDARRCLAADPSLTALYRAHGHDDYRRGQTRITARLPSAEETRLLRMAPSVPVLVTESSDRTLDGTILGTGSAAWASDRVQLTVDP